MAGAVSSDAGTDDLEELSAGWTALHELRLERPMSLNPPFDYAGISIIHTLSMGTPGLRSGAPSLMHPLWAAFVVSLSRFLWLFHCCSFPLSVSLFLRHWDRASSRNQHHEKTSADFKPATLWLLITHLTTGLRHFVPVPNNSALPK